MGRSPFATSAMRFTAARSFSFLLRFFINKIDERLEREDRIKLSRDNYSNGHAKVSEAYAPSAHPGTP
jgi:hypothetical protein